jgi:ADP-dependent NAD(P)H-hydrate dehydratase
VTPRRARGRASPDASPDASPRALTGALLRRMPLPALQADADKEDRGRVLVVGGSSQVPGAVLLAGVAALRAGAGKLQLATVRAAAVGLGLAVPEALVVALAQTRAGEIAGTRAAGALRRYAGEVDALLVGPGMATGPSAAALLAALVPLLGDETTLVLDGAGIVALGALGDDARRVAPLAGRVVLTPHAGEMAALLGIDKRAVEADPPAAARHAAQRYSAVVALKGAETWIADPDGTMLRYRGGSVGLGTSGSGDTLSGIVTGLAAGGASPLVAAAWSVWAHGAAGRILARRTATVGFLARELLAEVPALVCRR